MTNDKWTPKKVNPNDAQRQMTWYELADALAASERQRKELEAQVVVLAEAIEEAVYQRDIANWSNIRSLLANLPAAVQQHLERDRALFDFVESIAELDDEHMNIYNINQTALNARKWAKEALAAYRAAGGGAK